MSAVNASCTTCRIAFESMEVMRTHYSSELHLQNVRLRVEGKRPMTQTEFRHAHSGLADGDDAAGDADGRPIYSCTLCKKTFRSTQTLQAHVRSTAHLLKKEERILARDSEVASMLSSTSLGSAAMGLHRRHRAKKPKTAGDEAEKQRKLQEKQPVSLDERELDVDELRCLFCGFKSTTVEDNLVHLQRAHDFVIPMASHCTDTTGMLSYLARKVNGLLCLVCGTSTKSYSSLEALRAHMNECDHQKVMLNSEYNEFYDIPLDDGEAVDTGTHGNSGAAEEQLVVFKDGVRKTVYRREEGGLNRRRETDAQAENRRAILSADMQAKALIKKERMEALRVENKNRAKDFQRQDAYYQRRQLKVSMRSNLLHPKGYDGEAEIN